jgi:DNA processing protein
MRFLKLTMEELLGKRLNSAEEKHAPEAVYVVGRIPIPLPAPRVSVIGTRKPSSEGIELTKRLVRDLVREGVTIVSGLARGIDTVAHTTAIEEGGRTIAVLGTPVNVFYPPENKALQLRLMREQMVISQFPLGSRVSRKNFPMRNRTMALISDATVIVEAGEKSGTIYQGWECLRLGRPLLIHASLKDLTWVRKMTERRARLFRTADEVLEVLRRTVSWTYSTNSFTLPDGASASGRPADRSAHHTRTSRPPARLPPPSTLETPEKDLKGSGRGPAWTGSRSYASKNREELKQLRPKRHPEDREDGNRTFRSPITLASAAPRRSFASFTIAA